MKRKLLTLFLAFALVASGCNGSPSGNSQNSGNAGNNGTSGNNDNSENNGTNNDNNGTSNNTDNNSNSTAQMPDTSDLFTNRDYEVGYKESESALIELNGTSASCDSKAVQISGSTITILDEGTYILRGTLNDGMIIVNTDKKKKVQLYLDNANINSETSAPIYILQADKVFITLAPDSENSLSNGGSFVAIDDNNIDATIFSKDDLTLNGSGTLTIESPAGHGIVSKDELTFTSGTYNISSASHAVNGKDNLCIANAVFNIQSGKDGLRANNDDDTSLGFIYIQSGTFDITAEGDGVSASSTLQIDGGAFEILSGGGSENGSKPSSDSWGGFPGNMGGGGRPNGGGGGYRPRTNSGSTNMSSTSSTTSDDDSTSIKGMKSSGNMLITNGTFDINSADDTIHSNASITISGGTFNLASGDDGIHADETLDVKGGTISISECYEGLEALHIYVREGDIDLVATDDGLNAAGGTDSSGFGGNRGNDWFGGMGGSGSSNGSINILGGDLYINSSGDGMDANGTLTISGGHTIVCGPTQGDTATLDYDVSGIITGGTFIGTGASGMAQTFSDSEQGVIAVRIGNQSAGTKITLEDTSGNVILTHEPELDFAVIILSSPEMKKGETYKIIVGDMSEEFTAS